MRNGRMVDPHARYLWLRSSGHTAHTVRLSAAKRAVSMVRVRVQSGADSELDSSHPRSESRQYAPPAPPRPALASLLSVNRVASSVSAPRESVPLLLPSQTVPTPTNSRGAYPGAPSRDTAQIGPVDAPGLDGGAAKRHHPCPQAKPCRDQHPSRFGAAIDQDWIRPLRATALDRFRAKSNLSNHSLRTWMTVRRPTLCSLTSSASRSPSIRSTVGEVTMAAFRAAGENLPNVTKMARSAPFVWASRWNRATTSRPMGRPLGSNLLTWTATREDSTGLRGAVPMPSMPSSPVPPTRSSCCPYRRSRYSANSSKP